MSLLLTTSTVAGRFPPLAHQGGWDEILLVVAPLALVGLLLYVANRRVNAQLEQARDAPDSPPTPGKDIDIDTDSDSGSGTGTGATDTTESEDSPA